MTESTLSLAVKVDATNPGQFFACCGLLELAHRLWPGAEGWFSADGFHILTQSVTGAEVVMRCLATLQKCSLQTDNTRGQDAFYPIRIIGEGNVAFLLDWWIDKSGKTSPLKLWAGRQTSLTIMQTLRDALPVSIEPSHDMLFTQGAALTGRFGVDPRAAWNALDSGFSPNEQQMEVYSYPAVELLAAVGLQGFRPREVSRSVWQYTTWSGPSHIAVARVASAGLVSVGQVANYRFEIAKRGSFKGFNFSTLTGDQS